MDNASRKRASAGGRPGQPEGGLARFEVRGLDTDRTLIRALARRLAEDGPEAARLRSTVAGVIEAEAPKPRKGDILAALRASPLVGSGIDLTKTRHPGRDIDL